MSSITPLLTKLKDSGTFLTFQSAAEDIGFTFNNGTTSMRFSHFVLMDIPNIESPTDGSNTIDFRSIESVYGAGTSGASPALEADQIDLAESLQNYMLNLEASLLNHDSYNPSDLETVAERVFFKWLKELGAIRFQASDSNYLAVGVDQATTWQEESDNDDAGAGNLYNSVIKYIGEIDIDGSHKSGANAFKELYLMVPTQHGSTPAILLKSGPASSYQAGVIQGDDEYIIGRGASDNPSDAGLRVLAQYDIDVPLLSYEYETDGVADSIWFDSLVSGTTSDAYVLGPTFNDATNEEITRAQSGGADPITFIRNRLDGVTINFNTTDYKYLVDNAISTFNSYNGSPGAGDFSFNTIGIYYEVWNNDDPNNRVTNLYGLLFLDDLEQVGISGAKISSFNKIKPNTVLKKQGNSYGIKLNFKFDVTADNVDQQVEVSVNDYNTFSMLLFTQAMENMHIVMDRVETLNAKYNDMQSRLEQLEQLVVNNNNLAGLQESIAEINKKLIGITPNSEITGLIAALNTKINQLASGDLGEVSVNVLFDLVPKGGVYIQKDTTTGAYVIGNKNVKYDYADKYTLRGDASQAVGVINVVNLRQGNNGLVYHSDTADLVVSNTMHIYVNDAEWPWESQKSLRIVFNTPASFGPNTGLVIHTGQVNGVYQSIVGSITVDQLTTKPVIDIFCIDAINNEFIITTN